MRKKGEHAFGSRRVERGCPPPQSLRSALRLLFLPPLSNPVFSGSGCFYTDNSTRKGGTVQRGLPRESFEQNEVDGYRAGRPQEPSGARSNPPEAVGHGVPPRERASSRWSSGCLHRSAKGRLDCGGSGVDVREVGPIRPPALGCRLRLGGDEHLGHDNSVRDGDADCWRRGAHFATRSLAVQDPPRAP